MRIALLCTLLCASGWSCLAADELKPVELTLHARAIESPALKYRLLPNEADLKPGNAVPILLRIPWENTSYFSSTYGKLKELDARPLTDPAWKEGESAMPFFDEMRRAAFRRDASWEYPIGEEPAEFILLPDAQGLRRLLGDGLSVWIRAQLLQGDLEEAREGILVGLANARHMCQTPFFVIQLIAGTVHRTMLDRTADLIGQPNSPNLYWALTTLPPSLLDLNRAANLEASMFPMTFPAASELDRPRSEQEWSRMLDQLVALLFQVENSKPLDPQEFAFQRAKLVEVALADEQKVLLPRGPDAAKMSDDETAVRWYVQARAKLDQQRTAVLSLPPTEAWPRLKAQSVEQQRLNETTPLGFGTFDPTAIYLSAWSLNRQIAALRIIEAVRHHLATHDGRLPASLNECELPIPNDPLSGEPFAWSVDGKTATLKALFLPVAPSEKLGREHRVYYRLQTR